VVDIPRQAEMEPETLVRLRPLMALTPGSPDVVIGLIDGPVAVTHPGLATENIRIASGRAAACSTGGAACAHGTFVAGILAAQPDRGGRGICPGSTLLVCPIFADTPAGGMPRAGAGELAAAINQCVDAGARIINVSASVTGADGRGRRLLVDALDQASRQGALVIAAAGNERGVGKSILSGHPWVLPVVGYSKTARPLDASFLGSSVGARGLGAPGEDVLSLSPEGTTVRAGGTSVAAPFVTGTAALIRSLLTDVPAASLKWSLGQATQGRRRGIVPPLLDAWTAYQLAGSTSGRWARVRA
jgi:subtilisin family serine protease